MNYTENLKSYGHLNGSFSDNIGLFKGKAGLILALSCSENEFYKTEVSYNFIEDVFLQIGNNTSFTYGSGIAGIGTLLGYLNYHSILEVNVEEVLEEYETKLFFELKNGISKDYTLDSGLAGYGIYLLSRIQLETVMDKKHLEIKDIISNISKKIIEHLLNVNNQIKDMSLWTGIAGMYMFLSHGFKRGILNDRPKEEMINVINRLLLILNEEYDNDSLLQLYFVMINCSFIKSDNKIYVYIINSLKKYLLINFNNDITATKELLFKAFIIKQISHSNNGIYDEKVENLLNKYYQIIDNDGIKKHYPYEVNSRFMNIGLNNGISGDLLSLNSIINEDFRWIKIFGY